MEKKIKYLYTQAVRREIGNFNSLKLEVLFEECLAELKRRNLKDSFNFVNEVMQK